MRTNNYMCYRQQRGTSAQVMLLSRLCQPKHKCCYCNGCTLLSEAIGCFLWLLGRCCSLVWGSTLSQQLCNIVGPAAFQHSTDAATQFGYRILERLVTCSLVTLTVGCSRRSGSYERVHRTLLRDLRTRSFGGFCLQIAMFPIANPRG